MNGWIKLHRSLLENVDLMTDHTACLVFIILLLKSSPEGKVLISTRKLGEVLDMDNSTVYRALQRLESYQMTQRTTQHKKSLILICNWKEYQQSTQRTTQHRRNSDATVTQRTTGGVRIKNKNKKGNDKLGKGYDKALEIRNNLVGKMSI